MCIEAARAQHLSRAKILHVKPGQKSVQRSLVPDDLLVVLLRKPG